MCRREPRPASGPQPPLPLRRVHGRRERRGAKRGGSVCISGASCTFPLRRPRQVHPSSFVAPPATLHVEVVVREGGGGKRAVGREGFGPSSREMMVGGGGEKRCVVREVNRFEPRRRVVYCAHGKEKRGEEAVRGRAEGESKVGNWSPRAHLRASTHLSALALQTADL